MTTAGAPDNRASGENVDTGEIHAELERILSSSPFRSSERIRQFLRFVVEETLSGRSDGIKAYSIAIDCFEREGDFDPQIDPYVRIVARRLRRALKHYYEEQGAGDAIRIDVPKGSYVPRFCTNDTSGDGAGEARPRPAGVSGAARPQHSEVAEAIVAIVHFAAPGEDGELACLASGLTQEVILALSRFSPVQVVGPIVVEGYDVHGSSPPSIGREHGADFALAGTVQRLGDRLRVSISLSDVSSSTMIWAQRYERDLTVDDLFGVQDEIAAEAAATIGGAAGVIVRRSAGQVRTRQPRTLSSYEAALKGFHWGMVLTDAALVDAHDALVEAVESDPEYVLTKALLSDIYFSDWLSAIGRYDQGLDGAESLARDAVALDRDSADARWAMGQVHYARRRFVHFEESFDAAVSLNPNNALYLASYGLFLIGLQEWDRAQAYVDRAMLLNPHHPPWYFLAPYMQHARKGAWEEALVEARSFSGSGLMWGPLLQAAALGHLERVEEAEPHLADLIAVQPTFAGEGRVLVGRLLYASENVDPLLEGLLKAGLEVA